MAAYATVAEYRLDSDDQVTAAERIEPMLEQQSAKLRSVCGLSESRVLTDDQKAMARYLVVDSVMKRLKPVTMEGIGDVSGATQASFTANGFSTNYTFQNPSGAAYFDLNMLAAFKSSLRVSQRVGTVMPSYGALS